MHTPPSRTTALDANMIETAAPHPYQHLMDQIDPTRVPRHVAIIMDGNGRWARERGRPRLWGHQQGYKVVQQIVRDAPDIGIKVLTLYVFSAENWKRPKHETDALMVLIEKGARTELAELNANGVRMRFSGRTNELPPSLQEQIRRDEEQTAHNTRLTLNLCINYGGRTEIVDAAKRLVDMARRGLITADDVTPDLFAGQLYNADLPDPDLMIRTAGEMRVSNYLLWQVAYSELHVTPTLWPDFTTGSLLQAILDYQGRTRKFGGLVDPAK
jgi:undecaprenyl diphosphate synthase